MIYFITFLLGSAIGFFVPCLLIANSQKHSDMIFTKADSMRIIGHYLSLKDSESGHEMMLFLTDDHIEELRDYVHECDVLDGIINETGGND